MNICTFCGCFPAQEVIAHETSAEAHVCEHCAAASELKLRALDTGIDQLAYSRHCAKEAFHQAVFGFAKLGKKNRFNYDHPAFREAAHGCKRRARHCCQRCGKKAGGVQAHHWARAYKPASETTAADLTALCAKCHQEITWVRRGLMSGQLQYPIYIRKLHNAIRHYSNTRHGRAR